MSQIPDAALRKALEREVADLKKRLTWGLVFERHIPETTSLLDGPVRPGAIVWERRTSKPRRFRVRAVEGEELLVVPEAEGEAISLDAEPTRIACASVLVEKPFAEPVHPSLRSLGIVRRGAADRPSHAVIDAENFHALQLLVAAYEGQADCLYFDPPYNTGALDWKYNNRFVDSADRWKHSKWLSFMEKRLLLAKRLLKRDGVLIVTIDEHEVNHLGMLLEQVFRDRNIQMVSAVINPKGVTQDGLSRVDEYIFFVMPVGLALEGRGDDMLTPGVTDEDESLVEAGGKVRWQGLLHSGEGARRQDRENMFYPVLIDPERGAVLGAGEPLLEGEPDLDAKIDGFTAVWPIRKDGSWGRWYLGHQTLRALADQGYVSLGGYDTKRHTWALSYLYRNLRAQIVSGAIEVVGYDEVKNVVEVRFADVGTRRIKTVWHRSRHDAGAYGADLVRQLLGERRFSFPKSLYSVYDALYAVVRHRPDALIIDAFAGSGTTLHATMLLNAALGGQRRCVLVTNNEVEAATARRLAKDGKFRGDPEYEAEGIFESATRPRVTAALTGRRSDGAELAGTYIGGRPLAAGFEENVEFFRLEYLDPADVELGLRFADLLPVWWLQAGGIGERESIDPAAASFALPAGSPYAFLFNPAGMPSLLARLAERPDVTHAYVLADTDEAFSELASQLPPHLTLTMLYQSYLDLLRGMSA